jgi:SNF2-related domain
MINQEFYYSDQFGAKGDAAKLRKLQVTKFDVLITTFEIVMVAKDVLCKIKFRMLIVDEAHKLKNHKARIFEELATVPRDYCVLLTGEFIAIPCALPTELAVLTSNVLLTEQVLLSQMQPRSCGRCCTSRTLGRSKIATAS